MDQAISAKTSAEGAFNAAKQSFDAAAAAVPQDKTAGKAAVADILAALNALNDAYTKIEVARLEGVKAKGRVDAS